MNVLCVAAHPDDEVLGCGGTIARLAKEGHDVLVAILGEGITSRHANREDADAEQLDVLRSSSQTVANLLGVKKLFMFNLPDNRFDTVPLLEIVKIIEGVIEKTQPEIVFTQHGGDLNLDHVITHRATLTATRPMAGGVVRAVYAYEVASSTEWAFQAFAPAFHPNTFVDISATLELKLQAMQLYSTEQRPFPHPRSQVALKAIAQHWGRVAGLQAAEAFELVREIR